MAAVHMHSQTCSAAPQIQVRKMATAKEEELLGTYEKESADGRAVAVSGAPPATLLAARTTRLLGSPGKAGKAPLQIPSI